MVKPYFSQNQKDMGKLVFRDFVHCSITKIFLFSLLLLSAFSYATPTANVYEIKAAFLYKLKYFVNWPQQNFTNNNLDFFICILGQDPFNEKIDLIVGEQSIGERSVKVLRIAEIEQAENCQILFISESKRFWLESIFKWLGHKPILNVSDIQDFAENGGMIEFYTEEDKVRLAINSQSLNEATLKVSSHLLKISRVISNMGKQKTNEPKG